MYASVRRYKVHPQKIGELERRLPIAVDAMSALNGFRAYYVIKGDDGSIASVSLFSSSESAAQSNVVAAQYVRENVADLLTAPVDTITGEVIAYA